MTTKTADTTPPPAADPPTPCLALRSAQAARALGIGTRKLWELTNRGEIPHLKLGKAVLYPVDQLRVWLGEQTAKVVRR